MPGAVRDMPLNLRMQSDVWVLGKILALTAKTLLESGAEAGDVLVLARIAKEIENTLGYVTLDVINARLSGAISHA